MDKLTSGFDPKSKAEYHPAIKSAMRLGELKMNRYYSLTDGSAAYRIAMGEYGCNHTPDHNSKYIVLHPGLKLEYFRGQEWEQEWIDEAENLTREEYIEKYENVNVVEDAEEPATEVSAIYLVTHVTNILDRRVTIHSASSAIFLSAGRPCAEMNSRNTWLSQLNM
jgi:hypothetical protein